MILGYSVCGLLAAKIPEKQRPLKNTAHHTPKHPNPPSHTKTNTKNTNPERKNNLGNTTKQHTYKPAHHLKQQQQHTTDKTQKDNRQ